MALVTTMTDNPLVTWVQSFTESNSLLDIGDLGDGVYLNDVFINITEPEDDSLDISRAAKDTNSKLHNWWTLIKNILAFYQDTLQQLVVCKVPDIITIVKEPTKECSVKDVQSVLLLLLGCAVQCDRKEEYINKIKTLDITVQADIVKHIQEITDHPENVMSMESFYIDSDEMKNFYNILKNLVNERDSYAERVVKLTMENDYCRADLQKKTGWLTPPASLEKYHSHKQNTELRNQVRNLTEDVEEKSKTLCELTDELSEIKTTLASVKAENFTLRKDATLGRNYRDELDAMKEQALKVSKYEKEITKYKERLAELEFYKTRVEELRDDNTSLVEAKVKAEEATSTNERRLDQIRQDLLKSQLQIEELVTERDQGQKKVQELLEEIASLEYERSKDKERSAGKSMVSYSSSEFLLATQQAMKGNPLSEELKSSFGSDLSKLEMENDELRVENDDFKQRMAKLQQKMDSMKKEMQKEHREKVAILEKEARESRRKMTQELSQEYESKLMEIKQQTSELKQKLSSDFAENIAALKKGKDDCVEENEQLKLCLEKEKQIMVKLEKKKDSLSSELKDVKMLLDTKESEHVDAVKCLQNNNGEHRENVVSLKRELANYKDKLREVEHEMDKSSNSLTDKLAIVVRDKDTAEAKYKEELQKEREKSSKILQLSGENRMLQKQIVDLRSDLTVAKELGNSKISDSHATNLYLQREVECLKEELKLEQKEVDRLANVEREKYEIQRQFNVLNENCIIEAERTVPLKQVQQEKFELERELHAVQTRLDDVNVKFSQVNKLEKERVDLKKQLSTLESEKKKYRDWVRSLEQKNKEIETQFSFIQEQCEESQRHYSDLEDINRNLKSEKEQLQHTLYTMRQTSEARVKELQGNLESLKVKYDKVKKVAGSVKNLCDMDASRDSVTLVEAMHADKLATEHKENLLRSSSRNGSSATIDSDSQNGSFNTSHSSVRSSGRHHGSSSRQRPASASSVPSDHHRRLDIRSIASPHRIVYSKPEVTMREQQPFIRNDKFRTTVQSSKARPVSAGPFDRHSRLRASMPERKIMYTYPEKHPKKKPNCDISDSESVVGTPSREHGPPNGASTPIQEEPPHCVTDSDGNMSSASVACSASNTDDEHVLTSMQFFSSSTCSETIRAHYKISRNSDKAKPFIDKIVELQDKNQNLTGENSELRKVLNSLRFSSDRMEILEKKNLELEAENRKLKTIVESLSNGRNPYDSREYHYFTNV